MASDIFVVVNGIIALSYGMLAIFFARKIRLTGGFKHNWRALTALAFAAIFFIGCAHTHFDLMIYGMEEHINEHWFSWWNVSSHVLQAIGGIGFYILATKWIECQIYDKKDYDEHKEQIKELFNEL